MKNFVKTIKYPSKREVMNLTVLTTASMLTISAFIFGVDAVIMTIYNLLV